MRAARLTSAAAAVVVLAACGGDDAEDAVGAAGLSAIEVVIAEDTSPIARLRDVSCERVDDNQLTASGIVSSAGDETHYVSIQVRFVDGDGVRVELGTDQVAELLIGETARWDATTYADGAPDVQRCEVTATVS